MIRRELLSGLAAAALASGCTSQTASRVQTSQAPSSVQPSEARYGSPMPLPSPDSTGTISLEKAIGKRRSLRAFRPDPLPVATIGQLLWAGQGVTSPDGKRAAPSAGALYPLELYAVTPEQVMHYLPDGHRAETRAVSDLRPELRAAAVGQSSVGAAPVVIVVAAVPGRLSSRYGTKAEEYTQIEVGHASQNILLQAAALGLAAVPVGSLDPSRVADTLALPSDQTVLYLIPVGHVP
jgi:SagB-type dehydrogenase family enzyme